MLFDYPERKNRYEFSTVALQKIEEHLLFSHSVRSISHAWAPNFYRLVEAFSVADLCKEETETDLGKRSLPVALFIEFVVPEKIYWFTQTFPGSFDATKRIPHS